VSPPFNQTHGMQVNTLTLSSETWKDVVARKTSGSWEVAAEETMDVE